MNWLRSNDGGQQSRSYEPRGGRTWCVSVIGEHRCVGNLNSHTHTHAQRRRRHRLHWLVLLKYDPPTASVGRIHMIHHTHSPVRQHHPHSGPRFPPQPSHLSLLPLRPPSPSLSGQQMLEHHLCRTFLFLPTIVFICNNRCPHEDHLYLPEHDRPLARYNIDDEIMCWQHYHLRINKTCLPRVENSCAEDHCSHHCPACLAYRMKNSASGMRGTTLQPGVANSFEDQTCSLKCPSLPSCSTIDSHGHRY